VGGGRAGEGRGGGAGVLTAHGEAVGAAAGAVAAERQPFGGEAGGGVMRRKYGNIPTAVDGITFASRKEARRWGELVIMQRAGLIRGLEPHPRYELVVNGRRVGHYTADFRYTDAATGAVVVEDTKSPATRKEAAYRLRRELMLAVHGIDVKEV
jgi:hypothetical protein